MQPKTIVTLGNVALKALLGQEQTIGQCHGVEKTTKISIPGEKGAWSCRVYPLYHPASIIYNRALVATYQEDLLRLRELLVERGVVK